jgi:epoxyqueuosine reductase
MHICCAPCAIMPIKKLKTEYEIIGLFYNPNIHPYKEYIDRAESVKKLSDDFKIEVVFLEYDYVNLIKKICSTDTNEPSRCKICYEIRLAKLNDVAVEKGIKLVTTTLLYSIYQKHKLIIETAKNTLKNTNFIYEDFRPSYREGVNESIKLGYYRQKYCGCIFSNYDRYFK